MRLNWGPNATGALLGGIRVLGKVDGERIVSFLWVTKTYLWSSGADEWGRDRAGRLDYTLREWDSLSRESADRGRFGVKCRCAEGIERRAQRRDVFEHLRVPIHDIPSETRPGFLVHLCRHTNGRARDLEEESIGAAYERLARCP